MALVHKSSLAVRLARLMLPNAVENLGENAERAIEYRAVELMALPVAELRAMLDLRGVKARS